MGARIFLLKMRALQQLKLRCRGFLIRDVYLPRTYFAKNLQPILSEYKNKKHGLQIRDIGTIIL